jgi:hypothetical protein
VLVDGADVGLAFYVPSADSTLTGLNAQVIGLSSGKLAYYLRAGLPVVVNRLSSVGELVSGAGCGIAVESASEVGAALSDIAGQYAEFSERALDTFRSHIDPAQPLQELIGRLHALERAAA